MSRLLKFAVSLPLKLRTELPTMSDAMKLKTKVVPEPPMVMGLIIFAEILMVIIGIKLGFFSAGLIITITVISIAVLGVFFFKFFTGVGGSNGGVG